MFNKAHIFPIIQAFSGTETVNHFFGQKSTDITIYDRLDLNALESAVKRQVIARKYLPNPWCMTILDDVSEDSNLFARPVVKAIMTKGRHLAMLFILAVQYALDLKPAMRTCIDYLFILPNSIPMDRQKLYENFASIVPTYQDFCDIMDSLEDHMSLVIDNTIASSKIQDRVFYYRADPSIIPDGWKIGCPDAWKFHEERIDPNYQPSII